MRKYNCQHGSVPIDLTKYIGSTIPHRLRDSLTREYSEFEDAICELDYINKFTRRRVVISMTALRISRKIREKYKINLFPAIFRLNVNFTAYPEAYTFYMYDKNGVEYYFDAPAKCYALSKTNIKLWDDGHFNVFLLQYSGACQVKNSVLVK